MSRRYASMVDRILANSVASVENFYQGTPCWEWLGKTKRSRTGAGRAYPALTVHVKGKGPRNVPVHRLVLDVFKGKPLRRTQVAAHQCNNTFCVNPEHIKPATQRQNMAQCVEEGRHNSNPANDFHLLDTPFDDPL